MLSIPADEVAVGDYSPEQGTVRAIKKGPKLTDPVEILFHNGNVKSLAKDVEIEMIQGGRFDRPVDPNTKRRTREEG